jgi:hypothetical protein
MLIAMVYKTTTAINVCFNSSDPEIFSAVKLSLALQDMLIKILIYVFLHI